MGTTDNSGTVPQASFGKAFSALSLIAILVFVALAYAYARWGGPFVTRLSEDLGEIVAQRATDLADAGMTSQAIDAYRVALTRRYEDEPTQRVYTMQRLARLLLAENQGQAAVAVMEEAFALDPRSGPSYTLLFQSLLASGNTDRALDVTRDWYKFARGANDIPSAKWAKYNEGAVHRDAERWEEAFAAFTESHALQPSQESALQIASAAFHLGRFDATETPLDFVRQHGDAQYVKLADDLAKEIDSARQAGHSR